MVPDLTAVERYLQDRERTPFFLFAGGSVYAQLRHGLQGLGLHLLTLSSLFSAEDRLPLPDDIVTTIKTKVQSGEKILLIGLAEYLALCGEEAARRLFSRLKSMPCGEGAALLLLRGFFVTHRSCPKIPVSQMVSVAWLCGAVLKMRRRTLCWGWMSL